jgi:hypothetical protein
MQQIPVLKRSTAVSGAPPLHPTSHSECEPSRPHVRTYKWGKPTRCVSVVGFRPPAADNKMTNAPEGGGDAMLRTRILAGVALVALLAPACGGGEAAGSSGGGDGSFAIASPSDGAEVSLPFTLEFSSGEKLGPTDTGAPHVHVFFDGDDSNYEVVESDSFEVAGLSPGQHTVTASLRNADHSAAGAEAEISVEVTEGGGGDTDEGAGRDDYDY